MNLEKAKRLLEMLRRRTVERGATAAEAAQAAALAAKIIERFGLDLGQQAIDQAVEIDIDEKRALKWVRALAVGISIRFKVTSSRLVRPGEPVRLRFEGPEHAASVAAWLFEAIAADMRKLADAEVRARKLVGPFCVKFRNEFLDACAWQVTHRLNEPAIRRRVAEIREARANGTHEEPTTKRRHRAPRPLSYLGIEAMRAGSLAGDSIKLDTNVLSNSVASPALLEDRRL